MVGIPLRSARSSASPDSPSGVGPRGVFHSPADGRQPPVRYAPRHTTRGRAPKAIEGAATSAVPAARPAVNCLRENLVMFPPLDYRVA